MQSRSVALRTWSVDHSFRSLSSYALEATEQCLSLPGGLRSKWIGSKVIPNDQGKLHQSTAASTWWCGPRPRLGCIEMAVGLLEGPSYPRYSPLFFHYAAPRTTAVGQHTASLKSVACFLFLSSSAHLRLFILLLLLMWAVPFIPTLTPSFRALCALEMWPGGASQCNAAPAPNGSI